MAALEWKLERYKNVLYLHKFACIKKLLIQKDSLSLLTTEETLSWVSVHYGQNYVDTWS